MGILRRTDPLFTPPRDKKRQITAAEKLMLLSLDAALNLFVIHLRLRAAHEQMDYRKIQNCAHDLLDIASEQERADIKRRGLQDG